MGKKRRTQDLVGYLFISPWLVGLVLFVVGPLVASLIFSFTDYDLLTSPKWIGLDNYVHALFDDDLFWQSAKVTVLYTLFTLPTGMLAGLALAILLNSRLRGMTIFRTIYYLPSVMPGVATAILWLWVFNPGYGLANTILRFFGMGGVSWLTSPQWVFPALVTMNLWGAGGDMIIYLANLRAIPDEIYDAAALDGTTRWQAFRFITLPLLTPAILINGVLGIIGSLRVFTPALVMTAGGPDHSTFFYMFYLYHSAFSYLRMGYASALAWILFLVTLALTLLILRSSRIWVYYQGELRGRRW